MDATANAGIKRYIIVSALDIRDRSKAVPDWYNEDDLKMSARVFGAIGPYLEASEFPLLRSDLHFLPAFSVDQR